MHAEYQTTLTDAPDRADVEAIGRELAAFNRRLVGDDGHRPLTLLRRHPEGTLVGGLVAETYWRWLSIDVLWVREDLRGQGHGGRLLAAAEAEAIRRGCARAHLDTFAFQAPAFYRKRGYAVFDALPDFVAGQTRYFLVKALPQREGPVSPDGGSADPGR